MATEPAIEAIRRKLDQRAADSKARLAAQRLDAETKFGLQEIQAQRGTDIASSDVAFAENMLRAKREREAEAQKAETQGKPAPPPVPAVGDLRAGQNDQSQAGRPGGIGMGPDGLQPGTMNAAAQPAGQGQTGAAPAPGGPPSPGGDPNDPNFFATTREVPNNFGQVGNIIASLFDEFGGTSFSTRPQTSLPSPFEQALGRAKLIEVEQSGKAREAEFNAFRLNMYNEALEGMNIDVPLEQRAGLAKGVVDAIEAGDLGKASELSRQGGREADTVARMSRTIKLKQGQLLDAQLAGQNLENGSLELEAMQTQGLLSIGINPRSRLNAKDQAAQLAALTTGQKSANDPARFANAAQLGRSVYANSQTNLLDGDLLVIPKTGSKWFKWAADRPGYTVPVQLIVDKFAKARSAHANGNTAGAERMRSEIEDLLPGMTITARKGGNYEYNFSEAMSDPELVHMADIYGVLERVTSRTFDLMDKHGFQVTPEAVEQTTPTPIGETKAETSALAKPTDLGPVSGTRVERMRQQASRSGGTDLAKAIEERLLQTGAGPPASKTMNRSTGSGPLTVGDDLADFLDTLQPSKTNKEALQSWKNLLRGE